MKKRIRDCAGSEGENEGIFLKYFCLDAEILELFIEKQKSTLVKAEKTVYVIAFGISGLLNICGVRL